MDAYASFLHEYGTVACRSPRSTGGWGLTYSTDRETPSSRERQILTSCTRSKGRVLTLALGAFAIFDL